MTVALSFNEFVEKWTAEESGEEFAQVIYIDIKRVLFGRSIGQFRWVAKNAGNNRKIAISGESYKNREDCLKAVWRLTGPASTVFVREAGFGLQLSRQGVRP